MHPLIQKIFAYDLESKRMIRWIEKYSRSEKTKVLDVGCGYGRLMKLIQPLGVELSGVEINPNIVSEMQKSGFRVTTPEDFLKHDEKYDLVVMSHVIEHFDPAALLGFMDFYLDRLKVGGKLLIATPLMSSSFFNDFDHVKPYQPAAIQAVFSGTNPQVQYHSRNRLKLLDLWFRKSYFRGNFFTANYLFPSFQTKLLRAFELFTACVVFASRGKVGTKTGWVGVFEKLE